MIGDGCHLTPGALIAGNCQIGPGSPGGMEATVPFDGHVGEQCLVHNNAAVNTTVPDRTVGFGEGRRGELAA